MEDQPRSKQSNELIYFTQTVINMEKTISRITKDRNEKTSEVYSPANFIDIISSDTHERNPNDLHRNVNLSQVKMKQSGQTLSEDSVLGGLEFEELGEGRRMATNTRESAIEMTAKKEEVLCQYAMGPRLGATREFEHNVVWPPPRKTQEGFISGLSNVTLSRVYFAQDKTQENGCQVSADNHEHKTIDPETNGHLTLQSEPDYEAKQRDVSINKIMQDGEEITNSSFSNLVSKSRRSRGMFEIKAASKYKKPGDKRLFSAEDGEYIYFLPNFQERHTESLRCDEVNLDAKSNPIRTHIPRDMHPRLEHLVSDGIAIYDKDEVVCTSGCKFGQANSNFVKVVADSEGRIFVNVAETANDERNITNPTLNGEKHRAQQPNYANIGRSPTDPSYHKYHSRTTGRPSETKQIENETAETRSQTSALITNDGQWDSWKKNNCIPCDKDGKNQRNLLTRMQFFDEDENNNNVSEDETLHLNKFIRKTRYSVPDNNRFGHAQVATHNSNYSLCCDENISKNITNSEICFENLPNITKDNFSRSFHFATDTFSDNNKRYVVMEKQFVCHKQAKDGRNLEGKLFVVPEVGSGHNLETRQQRCSLQEPNEDATFKRSGCQSRLPSKPTTVTVEDWDDHSTFLSSSKNNDTRKSFSTFNSKSSPSGTRGLPKQPKTQRQNGNTVISTADKEENRNKKYKENLKKCASSINCGRYLCDWPACDKTFRHYSFLVLHKRIHTGERPYVCSWEGCSKQFRRSDDYQRHYRVHTGLKPYICTFCGKGFKRSDHRLFHYRAIHNMKDSKKRKKENTNF